MTISCESYQLRYVNRLKEKQKKGLPKYEDGREHTLKQLHLSRNAEADYELMTGGRRATGRGDRCKNVCKDTIAGGSVVCLSI